MTDPTFPDLPGFTVLALAGQGGMGAVYKAEQHTPRRMVALKVLQGAGSAADLAAFRVEAQTIAALEHPYIVPLYTYGEHDGLPYLALRYFNGGTVAGRIAQRPIELNTAARWIISIAEALAFAHGRGIVHRDLKPSNILLDESNHAYLSDFGIAGLLASASSLGSAAYMSPEQGRGEATDARSDLYALAVTLFEMLTGQKPYIAETAFGVVVRHLNDPIPSARTLNPSIPPAVDELIQWTMSKSPAERPESATEFARLIKQAIAAPTTHIRPASPAAGLTAVAPAGTIISGQTVIAAHPPQKSHSALWLMLIGGAVLLCLAALAITLGGGALAFLAQPTATPVPTATSLPTREPTPVPTLRPTATLDPDGGVVVVGDTIQITVRRNTVAWYWPLNRNAVTDTVLEATVIQESGPDQNEMGLICRWQDTSNFVAFEISGDGHYRIFQKQAGVAADLIPFTESPSINQSAGAANVLRATCSGSSLIFEVNGVTVGEATDPRPISGDVAVMAGLREDGELLVSFEGLK